MLTQLYGVTCLEDAALCSAADHVGIVPSEGVGAWDAVEPALARQLLAALKRRTVRVLLSLRTTTESIVETASSYDADILHVARASLLNLDELAALRSCIAPKRLMCTVPILGPEAVELGRRLSLVADFLLTDSHDPSTGLVGATGLVHDWSLSQQLVASVRAPVILAGGLGPHNVVEAIRAVGPAGVDSETHTSREDDKRRKDPEKVRRFLELVRG
jgi:phosphoribosylanthranilate isomerase